MNTTSDAGGDGRGNFVRRFFANFWGSRKPLWLCLRMLLLLCVGLAALVIMFEDHFIYFPSKYPEGQWDAAASYAARARDNEIFPAIEDVWMTTADGVRIHGWHCEPRRRESGQVQAVETRATLLWFHGNAGNLSHRSGALRKLVELPASVLIVDYRGYGRSEGSPSERGLYLDARAAWDYLTKVRGVPARSIIIFGDSLGGAVAVDLAAEADPAGLIVQSSFTSIPDMAAHVMPFLPGFILRTKMDSASKIGRVRCPKLFIHSDADEMVPYELGRKLFDAAPEPKQFYVVEGAPHNLTEEVGGRAYYETLGNFVRRSTTAG